MPFAGFTIPQMQDMYFYYVRYRDKYCTENNTCMAPIGVVEFYFGHKKNKVKNHDKPRI